MIFVKDVMTKMPITLSPMDTLRTAREVMERDRIRHIPIVSSHGTFLGLLTQRDLLRASVSNLAGLGQDEVDEIEAGIPLAECMSPDVFTVSGDFALYKAAQMLLAHKFGCLPVVDNGKLVGILTESDFVRLALAFIGEED